MEDRAKVNTLVKCRVKLSKNDEGEKLNSTTFKSLIWSLRYLTCIRPNICFRIELWVGLWKHQLRHTSKIWSEFLDISNVLFNFGLFYRHSNNFELVGYNDSDWVRDIDDRKCTISSVFYMKNITFIWSLEK